MAFSSKRPCELPHRTIRCFISHARVGAFVGIQLLSLLGFFAERGYGQLPLDILGASPADYATASADPETVPGWYDASYQTPDSVPDDDLRTRIEQVEKELQEHLKSEKKKKEDAKKLPVIKPRGRLHADANWFNQSGVNQTQVGDIQDGVFFRRARLGFDGSFMENTEIRLDFEMGAPGHPNLFDAYGNLLYVPFLGTIRLGQFREPFSLEAQTSSNYYTFMERAFNNGFDPSRNWGIMFYNHNSAETVTWALGAFRDQTNFYGADVTDAGGRALTGRTTWLPYFDEDNDGDDYWAVGSSYSYRDPKNDTVNFPVKPLNFLSESRTNGPPINVPNILDLRNVNAESVQLFGFETTRTIGPLNLQAEYIGAWVDLVDASYLSQGSYVQASFFLTGEHRRWNRSLGNFNTTKVNCPFLTRRGKGFQGTGAWEIAIRWCDINIRGSTTLPGYARAYTAGLNWYLNENVRMMINASPIQLHSKSLEGDLNVFNTRMDIHF